MLERLKKRDPLDIYAPISGKYVPLEQVRDAIFASKVLGEGFAIAPGGDTVVAPFQGEVMAVYRTGHAIALKSTRGMEMLIHIGMDTVTENGKGFRVLVRQGDRVDVGQRLVRFDRGYLEGRGYDLTTPCVVTSKLGPYILRVEENQGLRSGRTVIWTIQE